MNISHRRVGCQSYLQGDRLKLKLRLHFCPALLSIFYSGTDWFVCVINEMQLLQDYNVMGNKIIRTDHENVCYDWIRYHYCFLYS